MKEDPVIQTFLGYKIQQAHMTMTVDARQALEPMELTPAKLTALLLIRANPGCDQTALGQALRINRSSAMKLVNALVVRDLIERRPGRNLRTNALYLRPGRENEIEDLIERLRVSDERMSARLDAEERSTLVRLLSRLGA